MILIVIAILLSFAGLVWLWKGPVSQSAQSLQEEGSSKAGSYIIIVFLAALFGTVLYLFIYVV